MKSSFPILHRPRRLGFVSFFASIASALAATATFAAAAPSSGSTATGASLMTAPSVNATSELGIGDIGYSNQATFERFNGAVYLSAAPTTLAASSLATGNGAYLTRFGATSSLPIGIGVRHSFIQTGRFAVLGDYSLAFSAQKGRFSSPDFTLTDSSSTASLITLSLAPRLLFAWFITDQIHAYVGPGVQFRYSMLQSPMSAGDAQKLQPFYGPVAGVQVNDLPVHGLFAAAQWARWLTPQSTTDGWYGASSATEFLLGLNF